VKEFWSLTVYDVATRCLINNKEEIADRSSRQPDLVKNADGSVDLCVGPIAPAGFEKNWIPTVPGKAWFPTFASTRSHRRTLQPKMDSAGFGANKVNVKGLGYSRLRTDGCPPAKAH
jgi:hypothetical protein